jgi:hypothetical protein
MNKVEILNLYDRSVYEIRLDIAIRIFVQEETPPQECLESADRFVLALMDEEADELRERFG